MATKPLRDKHCIQKLSTGTYDFHNQYTPACSPANGYRTPGRAKFCPFCGKAARVISVIQGVEQ